MVVQKMIPTLPQLAKQYHLPDNWLQDRPHLFSQATVPLSQAQISSIDTLIKTVESIIKLPAYQQTVLSWAPEIAQKDPGVTGVFFGYDFHLTPQGPKLIEINSNAGGAALAAMLGKAQGKAHPLGDWESAFVGMFKQEWQQVRGQQTLSCIAIVDENPPAQYLYPEFMMFQSILKEQGIETLILDPSELSFREGKLYSQKGQVIELVYNRLTDFSLSMPESDALRRAYLSDAVVLTPNPRSHALYADKRNLTLLSDVQHLQSWGVSQDQLVILENGVPRVFVVDPHQAETLWEMRKTLFFKPVAGYGGKGTYRGAKISRRVFDDILRNHYVAQLLIPPGEQLIKMGGHEECFKVDIRSYVYGGKPIGMVARLYQGQVTNMRTIGGGFSAIDLI